MINFDEIIGKIEIILLANGSGTLETNTLLKVVNKENCHLKKIKFKYQYLIKKGESVVVQ